MVKHNYVLASSALMRETPSINDRVVSEALYGEYVVIEEVHGNWNYVRTPDGYRGWIQSDALITTQQSYPESPWQVMVSRKKAHLYHVTDTEWGAIKTLPFGSPLQVIEDVDERWLKVRLLGEQEAFIQKGDVAPKILLPNKSHLISFSQQFLDLPYTWGGRSSFGFDCSGFVQMLYKQIGIELLRDSCLQVNDSRFHDVEIGQVEAGDLVFFGKDLQTIRHVGMAIGDNRFIHTSSAENLPFLRISLFSDHEWSGTSLAKYPFRLARQLN